MTATLTRPAPRPRRTRTRRRKPLRRFLIVSHRWLSLALGVVLLAITVSGSILLYRPEIERALHADAFDVSGRAPSITLPEAREIVQRAHPSFESTGVWFQHGVYSVTDDETSWNVDPADGTILGHVPDTPSWLAFLDNLHECLLSCEGEPGYVAWLDRPIPHTAWLGYEGETEVTGGGLVLGVLGLLLLYLSLTGIWLWFPRPSRWRTSMSVRWRRGRFARDTDLHKVAGMIVIPFLLMWAVTGAGFEIGLVEKAWFAATPGGHRHYADPLSEKAPEGTPDVTLEEAISAAERLHPDATLVYVSPPAKGDATAAYSFWFSAGFDPYGTTQYPGDLGVYVDRHTGVARDFYGAPGESVSQQLWDQWNFPTHAGYVVNGWWRLLWLLFGVSPLLLAVTGVSTWLVRRRTKRQRVRAARAGRATPPIPADLAEELVEDPEMDPGLADAAETSAT